jgi:hypothetical protein
MRADFGGGGVAIAHLPRRRARAQLFTLSGRSLLVAGLAVAALMIGLGVVTARADSAAPAPATTPYALLGR